jgi:DNA-binding beta-propeller fold protein YncE
VVSFIPLMYSGAVTTLAGLFEISGNQIGAGSNARFSFPYSIVVGTDPSTLYIADSTNNNVKIMTASGTVTDTLTTGHTFQGMAVLPSGTVIITSSSHTVYALASLGEGCVAVIWGRFYLRLCIHICGM